MSNVLKPGTTYIASFPNSVFTRVYTLLEIHDTSERFHTLYTFLDDKLNKIQITKGATEIIRFTEWHLNKPWVENFTPLKFDNNHYANSKEWASDDDLYG